MLWKPLPKHSGLAGHYKTALFPFTSCDQDRNRALGVGLRAQCLRDCLVGCQAGAKITGVEALCCVRNEHWSPHPDAH